MQDPKGDKNILIRADANRKIGLGHIKRCLALCGELKRRGFKPEVVIKNPGEGVKRLLRDEKVVFTVVPGNISLKTEAEKVAHIVERRNSSRIVFDSYALDAAYLKRVASSGAKMMMLDDRNYVSFPDVDYVVNGNSFAKKLKYRLRPGTKRYLGEYYYIMDRAYTGGKRKSPGKKAKKAAICLSGVGFEVFNKLVRFLLEQFDMDLEIYFTLFQKDIAAKLKKLYGKSKRLSCFVDLSEKELAKRLSKADIAVCTGGTILYKAIASGCAVLSLPAVKEQKRNIFSLEKKGSALAVAIDAKKGVYPASKRRIADTINDHKIRRDMVFAGMKIMDGKGTERVADILLR
jgi:spore coat polysaccharide biosynthesis predicted glycosyltransferase SpsG